MDQLLIDWLDANTEEDVEECALVFGPANTILFPPQGTHTLQSTLSELGVNSRQLLLLRKR